MLQPRPSLALRLDAVLLVIVLVSLTGLIRHAKFPAIVANTVVPGTDVNSVVSDTTDADSVVSDTVLRTPAFVLVA